jgi:hypothetical protein
MRKNLVKSPSSFHCFENTGNERRGFHANWYREYTPIHMANGFKRSAEIVVAHRFEVSPHGDEAFWPAVFLYRHAIELLLKEIVRRGSNLKGLQANETMLGKHALAPLWEEVKNVLKFPQIGHTHDEIDEVISDIQVLDPRGDAFRYYTSKTGEQHLAKLPKGTSLAHFAEKASKCVSLLEGMLTPILEAESIAAEMRAEYSNYE